MIDNLSYNKKCYLVLIGFVLFLFMGYQFSFSDTFKLKTELKDKRDKLIWLKDKEKELPFLKLKMAEFEKTYTKTDSISVRDKLTAYISEFAEENSCLVTEIPNNSLFINEELNVQTNTFTLKGNFRELLTLLYKLETNQKYLAKIMSVNFYSIKDLQTKKVELYLTIVAQSFEQKMS